ncbi:hypothetical protein [Sandaracinus amylolyticus]|nr:hypothetical protein [Sandaracinus amylolyticus]
MRIRRSWMLPLALVASACGGDGDGGTPAPTPSADAELDAYCAVAQRGDLATWVGDVLTLCASSGEDEVACSSGLSAATGAVTQIDLELAPLRVLPASGGRLVALLADERLVVLGPDRAIERELAAWASDPWVSDDGDHVMWVGLPDGVDAWDFGVPTVLATQSLDASARTVLVDDETASTPRPIPGSRDVLFVSTSTGLASFWRVTPGSQPVQLTNVGRDEVGPGFVPVADRQLAWSEGALFYGVDEEDGSTRIWRFDPATRDATEVGPGAWPRTASDGSVLALQPSGGAACAARYPAGGTP